MVDSVDCVACLYLNRTDVPERSEPLCGRNRKRTRTCGVGFTVDHSGHSIADGPIVYHHHWNRCDPLRGYCTDDCWILWQGGGSGVDWPSIDWQAGKSIVI